MNILNAILGVNAAPSETTGEPFDAEISETSIAKHGDQALSGA